MDPLKVRQLLKESEPVAFWVYVSEEGRRAPGLQHAHGIPESHKTNGDHTPQLLRLHFPGAAEVEAPRRNGFLSLPPNQREGKTVSLNKP